MGEIVGLTGQVCSATIRIAGVLPHDRMLPERGGESMGTSVRAGIGKNEPPCLRRTPRLDTPLECSNLPVWECIGLRDLETLEELLGCSIGLSLQPAADQGPGMLEGIYAGPLVPRWLWRHGMGRSHVAPLPGRPQTFQKRLQLRISARG
jgi:hypothetical protein